MNRKMVLNTIGKLSLTEAVLLLLPAMVSLCYKEFNIFLGYVIVSVIAAAIGIVLCLAFKPKDHVIYAKEGFVIVAGAWLWVSLIGCLPFIITDEIPNFANAFFETVSGFTTTGSSILTDVEALSHGNLFWRSFTHWVGGMGVLVFVMAIMPNMSDRSIHILRAEVPGPVVGKIVPRLKDTAKILYLIYIAFTVLEIVLLLSGGMNLFESSVHAFGTAGTGGFGIKADGIASYSPYLQWVIAIFMLIFGINFNLYYLILIRRIKDVFKSTELWIYVAIVLISSGIITANIIDKFETFSEAVRTSVFQVSSVITTTGYTTADFNLWPGLSKGILLLLMFVGGCAGSTAGGLKVSRAAILFKSVGREFKKMLHPRAVKSVHFEGKPVDESVVRGAATYFTVYIICLLSCFLLISFEPFSFETNFSASVTCFNNIGPGFDLVGPAGNFVAYSGFSKIVLSGAMLLGRLEIFPLLLFFSPSTWTKKG